MHLADGVVPEFRAEQRYSNGIGEDGRSVENLVDSPPVSYPKGSFAGAPALHVPECIAQSTSHDSRPAPWIEFR
jgi:hypothetical protein